nr:hypothetical protein B0A51_00608 [Rachicladosporium sp. CCFEE 5018]
MAKDQASINIPQLLAVALVGFLALRWYLNKSTSPSGPAGATSSSSRNSRAVDPAKIEQISAMFPQMDRRTIAWDLHRNGGSVAATSERILTGRGLDNPPPSYQPPLPSPPPIAGAVSGNASAATKSSGKAGEDLITRYGLQGRVGGKGKEAVWSDAQVREGWTGDKAARAEGLRRRREEMILAARRKMEERDALSGGT